MRPPPGSLEAQSNAGVTCRSGQAADWGVRYMPGQTLTRSTRGAVALLGVLAVAATPVLVAVPAAAAPPTPAVLVYGDAQIRVFSSALNGTGAKLVLSNAEHPVVSPSGTQIAFIDHPSGMLAVANINGAGRRILVPVQYLAEAYSWSPDGKFLAVDTGSGVGTVNVLDRSLARIPRIGGGDQSPGQPRQRLCHE